MLLKQCCPRSASGDELRIAVHRAVCHDGVGTPVVDGAACEHQAAGVAVA